MKILKMYWPVREAPRGRLLLPISPNAQPRPNSRESAMAMKNWREIDLALVVTDLADWRQRENMITMNIIQLKM